MNYIEETARLLGVELNEYFDVFDEKGREKGAYCFDQIGFSDSKVLLNILNGTYTIKKNQFKPKNGETYYFLAPDSNFNFAINKKTWGDYTIDYVYYKAGNTFRSVEEAKTFKDTLMNDLIEYYDTSGKKKEDKKKATQ